MEIGKVPSEVLGRLLGRVKIKDERVVLGPRAGEDAALIDFGDRLLVAKTDPVTFATDLIGWYAVQVNANDLAVMGARPQWFMATMLLPEGASEELGESIFDQLLAACDALRVTLVGGHSEITYRLPRPIVVGAMLGEVRKGREVTTGGAKVGDAIVVTKGVALEGTSLLAREAEDAIREAGVDRGVIEGARDLLFEPGISVVKEALAACEAVEVHSMHDPTEGGLATGLREIAAAAGVGLVVEEERIPVLPECRAVCDALGLDPLGLLASGALVITVAQERVDALASTLDGIGVPSAVLGRVTPPEEGIKMTRNGAEVDLPVFARDELARFLGP